MPDKVEGFLEVGCNEQNEIVINHPDLKPDKNGVGHIVFSINQARNLAVTLLKKVSEAEKAISDAQEKERIKNIPPVDRSKRCMVSGNPETPDHRELKPNGQQKDYVVLCPDERAKGFVRPVRRTYIHKTCRTSTTMGLALAETYARDPYFYGGTFCVHTATAKAFNRLKSKSGSDVRLQTLIIYECCRALVDLESVEQYRIFLRHVLTSERMWGGMVTLFVEPETDPTSLALIGAYADYKDVMETSGDKDAK